MKINIVGCGLSGIVSAILLRDKGHSVEIFDIRRHIGGNCFDGLLNNVTVHQYGPHIFHTNDDEVWEFVNRYTSFNGYTHRVEANTDLGRISIPYNKKTEEQLGRSLTPEEIRDLVFTKYSERHWGVPWDDLPSSITNRVPGKRDDWDDRYFTDKHQGIPVRGYTDMMNNMLSGIKVNLGVGPDEWKRWMDGMYSCDKLIYTGKVDDYCDHAHGHLPYRSLRFEHTVVTKDEAEFNWDKGAILNECGDAPYNRTSDNSVYLNEQGPETVITRDYPQQHIPGKNLAIYPMNFGEGRYIYSKYKKIAQSQNNVLFLGRLATYKYLDMWMAIKQVMTKLRNF